jgi:hypothetical protein
MWLRTVVSAIVNRAAISFTRTPSTSRARISRCLGVSSG